MCVHLMSHATSCVCLGWWIGVKTIRELHRQRQTMCVAVSVSEYASTCLSLCACLLVLVVAEIPFLVIRKA